MSNVHEKMQTDYLWLRDHSSADDWVKARTHGYHYLYTNVPNKRERLEMIHRSMGRQHDWELEKFRAAKKFPDRGNKKRWWKNLFRVLKHPLGYYYWKTYRSRRSMPRLIAITMGIGFTTMFVNYKQQSFWQAKKQRYLLVSGKNVEGFGLTQPGYSDEKFALQSMPLTQFLYYQVPGNKIVVNPCRDQNYRKYFELRKKYNITAPISE